MMYRRFLFAILLSAFVAPAAFAKSSAGTFGLNVGVGVPYLTQAGLNYRMSDMFSISAGYNLLDVDVDTASAKLAMPELLLNFHPFSGSYFIGAGVGQESLEVTATESLGTNEVEIDVDAMTTIVKTGWMWGASNGGFWFGIDFAYIMPSGAETTIKAPGVPTSDPSYQDAVDAADKFGDSAYGNITFIRLGYLF